MLHAALSDKVCYVTFPNLSNIRKIQRPSVIATFEAGIMRDQIHLGEARLIFVQVGPGAHQNLTFEQRAGFGPLAFDARRQALAIGGAHPNE
jgi:hypothetical protein